MNHRNVNSGYEADHTGLDFTWLLKDIFGLCIKLLSLTNLITFCIELNYISQIDIFLTFIMF